VQAAEIFCQFFYTRKKICPTSIVASEKIITIIKNVHVEVNIVSTESLIAISATNAA
jgi:hypothetical protein